jgi:hypothetical protein
MFDFIDIEKQQHEIQDTLTPILYHGSGIRGYKEQKRHICGMPPPGLRVFDCLSGLRGAPARGVADKSPKDVAYGAAFHPLSPG